MHTSEEDERLVHKKLNPLYLDERQQPVFQVQMHVRRRVPFLKIMPMHAMFAKLGIAKPQLFFSQVTHLLTPIAVWRSAANDEWFHHKSKNTAGLCLATLITWRKHARMPLFVFGMCIAEPSSAFRTVHSRRGIASMSCSFIVSRLFSQSNQRRSIERVVHQVRKFWSKLKFGLPERRTPDLKILYDESEFNNLIVNRDAKDL